MTTQQEHCGTWDDTWLHIQTEAVKVGLRAKQQQDNGCRIAFRGENKRICGLSQSRLWRDDSSDEFHHIWEKQINNLERITPFVRERNLDLSALHPSVPNIDGMFCPPSAVLDGVDTLLMDLQHAGEKTLLLDLTLDLNVALFFACYPNKRQAQKKDTLSCGYVKMFEVPESCLWGLWQSSNKRAQAQKGVQVLPSMSRGIEHVAEWVVPSEHRVEVISHLSFVHKVHSATLYPDLEGGITFQNLYEEVTLGD